MCGSSVDGVAKEGAARGPKSLALPHHLGLQYIRQQSNGTTLLPPVLHHDDNSECKSKSERLNWVVYEYPTGGIVVFDIGQLC